MKRLLIIFFLVSLILMGCNTTIEDKTKVTAGGSIDLKPVPQSNVLSIPGNSPGNINNFGIAATDGEWEYFWAGTTRKQDFGGGKLCKMRTDGTDFKVLSDDWPCYINVVGEWIYYIKIKGDSLYSGSIYKMRRDGTEKKELYNQNCTSMTVVGDIVYLINKSDGHRIYKMKSDGSELERLNDISSYDLQYADGSLYYSVKVDDNNFPLYKMKASAGSDQIKVLNNVDSYIMNNDYIYFSLNNKLYKARSDGTEIMSMLEKPISGFNIDRNELYCFSRDAIYVDKGLASYRSREVYKMKLDESNLVKLPNESGLYRDNTLCITGDNIYYWISCSEWFEIGKMTNNGLKDEIMIKRL